MGELSAVTFTEEILGHPATFSLEIIDNQAFWTITWLDTQTLLTCSEWQEFGARWLREVWRHKGFKRVGNALVELSK